MLNLLFKIGASKKAIYTISISFIFVSVILGVMERKISNCMMLFSFCLLLFFEIRFIKNIYSIKRCFQILIIYLIFTLALFGGIKHNIVVAKNNGWIFAILACLFFNTIIWIYKLLQHDVKHLIRDLREYISNHIWAFGLSLFALLLSVDTIKNIPIWDDYAYLYGIENAYRWNCRIDEIKSFFICEHVSLGYAVFTLLGAWLTPSEIIFGIRLIQIALTITALFLLYSVIEKKLKEQNKSVIFLFCCSITFFPVILGMQSINPDYYMLCFLIILICCNILELNELELFFSFCLCFSKEPGVVVYFGYCIGRYIYRVYENNCQGLLNKIKKAIVFDDVVSTVFIVFWFVIYKMRSISFKELFRQIYAKINTNMVISGKETITEIDKLFDATSGWKVSNGATNGFLIDYHYIKQILLQLLSINFIWISVTAAILCFIVFMFKTRKKIRMDKFIVLIASAVLPYVFFLCVFVTYPLYRYKMIAAMCIVVLSGYFVCLIIDSVNIKRTYFFIISLLFLIQSYICIDPVTNRMGRLFDTGNGILISTDKYEPLYISNNIMINHQGYEWLNFIQEALREINYNNQERILLIAPETEEPANYRSVFGIHYIEKIQHWEEQSRRIKVVGLEDRGEPITKMGLTKDGILLPLESGDDATLDFDKKYVFNFPFLNREEVYKSIYNAGYKIVGTKDVSYRTWKLEMIQIE